MLNIRDLQCIFPFIFSTRALRKQFKAQTSRHLLIFSSSTISIVLSPYWNIATDNSFLLDGLIHIHFVFLLLVISLFYRFCFSALLDSQSSPGTLYLALIHLRCKSSKCFGMLNIWNLWYIFHLLFKQFRNSTQKVQTSRKADNPQKLTNCSLYHCRTILKNSWNSSTNLFSCDWFLIGQSAWWLKLLPKSNHLFLLPPEPLCKISIQPVHNIWSKIKQKVKQTNTTEKHNLPGKGNNKYLNISAWLTSSIVTNGIVQIFLPLLYKEHSVIKWISSSDLLQYFISSVWRQKGSLLLTVLSI